MSAMLEAARTILQRGWCPIPVPAGEKASQRMLKGWPDLRLTMADLARYFAHEANLGVLLGPPSGELVDIDLDCPEARKLAPLYLPSTEAIYGRPTASQ